MKMNLYIRYGKRCWKSTKHISIIVDEYGCLRGVVSMEDVIETMTGVEIVDEDDVAVDMQVLAKEKSRLMMKKKGASFAYIKY